MKIIEWIINLFMYPIKWYWDKHKALSNSKNYFQIILMFFVSLSGICILGFSICKLVHYLYTEQFHLLILAGVIYWLYNYGKDKFSATEEEPEKGSSSVADMTSEQANNGYPIMRNIIFQSAKSVAADIGIKSPRLLQEIEMAEEHFIIGDGNICFYQFIFTKNAITNYTPEDLNMFKQILQQDISDKIRSGAFPNAKMEQYMDKYGNWYDSVLVDSLQDIGNMLLLQTVFCTPEYAEYLHQKRLLHNSNTQKSTSVETTWENRP